MPGTTTREDLTGLSAWDQADSSVRSSVGAELVPQALQVNRRDLLGGLIHEYELAAA